MALCVPSLHPPREGLFLTAPDLCLACVSRVVAFQLFKMSGSAVSVAHLFQGKVCVCVCVCVCAHACTRVYLTREPWVSDLLPISTRGHGCVWSCLALISYEDRSRFQLHLACGQPPGLTLHESAQPQGLRLTGIGCRMASLSATLPDNPQFQ